jgi:hypothetical protein
MHALYTTGYARQKRHHSLMQHCLHAARSDYIDVISKVVVPAIPDFAWGHLTNGDVDDDGFCIVTVKVTALAAIPERPNSKLRQCCRHCIRVATMWVTLAEVVQHQSMFVCGACTPGGSLVAQYFNTWVPHAVCLGRGRCMVDAG